MITRRDLIVAIVAAGASFAVMAWAQPGKSVLSSCVFQWNDLKATPNPYGAVRNVCDQPTATLDRLSIHITTLNAGASSHPPHHHPEEEIVILKEGTLECVQNGVTNLAGPGSLVFEASDQMHGVRNHGLEPATYYVIQWVPPGGVKAKSR